MSTKIYNGFKFKDCTSIDQAYDHLKHIRKKYVSKAQDNFNSIVVRLATFSYDDEKELKYKSYLNDATYELSDELNKDKNIVYGDFRSEILVGKVDNLVLGYYNLPRDFNQIFKKESFFKEYGYWNNTDKLSNVSQKNWNLRGQHWDSIFGDSFYLHKNMFSFKLVEIDDYSYNKKPYKESSIPTDEERINRLADSLTRKHFSDKIAELYENKKYSQAINFYNEPEYKEIFEKKKIDITLKPISIDILKQWK